MQDHKLVIVTSILVFLCFWLYKEFSCNGPNIAAVCDSAQTITDMYYNVVQ